LHALKKLTAIAFFLFLVLGAYAQKQKVAAPKQKLTRADSLRLLRDTTECYTLDNYRLFVLAQQRLIRKDSTLRDLHLWHPALQYYKYPVTDNPGRPVYPMIFQPDTLSGFNLGKPHFAFYEFNGRNARYYRTLRPYTEAAYNFANTGLPKEDRRLEQVLNILHTQRISPSVQIGFDFRRITAVGFYEHMWNGLTNVRAFSTYFSPASKYFLVGSFSFNNQRMYENGGLAASVDFKNRQQLDSLGNPLASLDRKEQYPVRLTSAQNQSQSYDLDLFQGFNIGTRTFRSDSASPEVSIPFFRVSNRFIFRVERYRYIDSTLAQDNFYPNYYFDTSRTFYRIYHRNFSGNVEFSFYPFRNKGSFNSISAGVQAAYLDVKQDSIFTTTYNVNLFSNLDFEFGEVFRLRARFDYFPLGYNQNDMQLKADLGISAGRKGRPKIVQLVPGVLFRLAEPAFLQQTMYSNQFIWNNNFAKTRTLQLNFTAIFPKWGLSLGGSAYTLGNFIYYDTTAVPVQATAAISGYNVWLKYDLTFARNFHFNNFVMHQRADRDWIRVAPLFFRSNFYYENKLFKKRLQAQIGFDVYYALGFQGYAYMPATGNWYLQNGAMIGNYPYIDVNVNIRIKRFRAFFIASHINQGFPARSEYFVAKGMPMPDRQFRVGISWGLFN